MQRFHALGFENRQNNFFQRHDSLSLEKSVDRNYLECSGSPRVST